MPFAFPRPHVILRYAAPTLFCSVAALTGACQRSAPPAPPPPPPTVTVTRPVQRQVTEWDEYPGRLAAPEFVELRARVSGYLESAPLKEGALVKAGDVLFEIDARPYRAALDQAEAQLAQAQAQARFAQSEQERIERLWAAKTAAETEYLDARRAAETAVAAIAAAQAAIELAQLNLEWCTVRAPINGRVGRMLVTPGNLINGGAGQATLLTTITSVDPMYCYVEVDERNVRRYQRLVREEGRPSARAGRLATQLALVDEQSFDRTGYIDFVDNQLDPNTGTITARGVFANPGGELLPGFYATLRIPGRVPYTATLIPEQAIGTNLAQQYVLVLDANDVVHQQPIATGRIYGNWRVVDELDPQSRIVINGLVQARPGIVVRAEELGPDEVDAARRAAAADIPGPSTGAPASQPAGHGATGQASAQSRPSAQQRASHDGGDVRSGDDDGGAGGSTGGGARPAGAEAGAR
jgi:RND family efflux transporter MFP subunit